MPTELAQPLYAIDPHRFEDNQRAFAAFVESRMCPPCQGKAKEGGKSRHPDPVAIIAHCCSGQEGYLSPHLPLLEMVFRLFLSQKNQPQSAEELSQALKERLAAAGDTRDVSPQKVAHLLDYDRYYGLRRLPSPEGEASVANLEAAKGA